ncbi:uncharacterized protein BHQ10_010271 [Talaromyces amestolkiae]|uniref:Major facilitator superfamily (MFS) profile domain-containing protein n=1 Tax=Talaromyces amestolkiae TaxID=1196081 RepID=A0A364LER4_TALAM|nr:uncharacterized protein BHQ10_010271 [Talaromyces amestolkiae]RAO74259.1 hypothetical protein BHQ10_010271 [Talaromyces amestolkiae]
MSFQNSDSEEGKSAKMKASDDSQQPFEQPITDSGQDKLAPEPALVNSDADKPEYATGIRLFLIIFTMNVSGLLTALEIGIIATAIPSITDNFHALNDTGWYGSATFLVTAATSGVWGKVYKYFHVKNMYLAAISIFLIGSIVVATAPDSIAVIIGRAIQGLGITGAMNGSVIVINYISHPSKQPMLIGIWMGIFMVSTVLGPIIGGALTSGVSWRWCFYINLPLGVPVVVLLLLFLHIPKHIRAEPTTWKEIILQLDLPGFSIILTSLVCYTLALQWGGQNKAWNNGSVIATLIKPRVVWANALWSFITTAAFYQVMFYLPIFMQSIHGQSAILGGVNTLPFLLFFGVGTMVSGKVVEKTRYLQPFQVLSALLMTAGMALLYTLDIDSSKARYIGPQVLFGFGVGFGNQIPMMAVQGLSKQEDVPSITGIMFMALSSSAVYFIVAGQSIFDNRLVQTLATIAPNVDAAQVLSTGASDIHKVYSGKVLEDVLKAYMTGIKDVFACALAVSLTGVPLAMLIPFLRLGEHKGEDQTPEEKAAAV